MATSVAQEDINFLRLAGLLIKIAPHAVRRKFDYEFHPTQLQNFLSQNQHTIHELTYKKRVITLPQYELLYSKGSTGVSSDMFDVTLMVCLLRHFIDLDIQNSLPLDTNLTMGADISRIRFYRNYIVHSDSGKVTGNKFSEIWICVAEAILRLEPDLKPEIDALMSLLITNDSDIIDFLRLEKDMENTNQHLSTVSQKLSTVSQQLETLEVETHNTRGSPGCGKSVAAHHVALKFEMEGYEIIPCDNPTDIIKHFTAEKIQVFVIDDVCGKFALNQHKADSWEQNDDKLSMLFKPCTRNGDNEDIFTKSKTKFIMTCRENIYSHKAFPNLTCFSHVQCSFSTTYKISPEEMRNIALSYVSEDIVNDIQNLCLYDFSSDLWFVLQKGKPRPVHIPQEFERVYLKRIHKEAMSGKYWEVFGGIQTENEAYRKVLLSYLKEQNTGKQTSYITGDDGPTPLFVSSSLGYLEFVKYFISKCPNHINFKDKEGHYETVKLLLDSNEQTLENCVETTIKDNTGCSILHAACENGHTEVVKLLIERGMNVNDTTPTGYTSFL
ncbi:unnamed protein product [Mytilus edulis]|uniref:DZIP3-like HEPN domain-containing protein n=1 Tax=Mytilus edulis TaxID=6550 RepID=A0A8S3TKL4_MYTED|nr:unnamed protein product [Mytilus edulis]